MYVDYAAVKGSVVVRVYNVYGNIVAEYGDHNLVVNLGRMSLAHLLGRDTDNASSNLDYWTPEWIAFGDGGHDPNDPTTPIAGTVDLESLRNEIVRTSITTRAFPNEYTLELTAMLGSSEGNGSGSQPLSEVGLITSGGDLFSYKAFGYVIKSSDLEIEVTWRLVF